jgi:predicted nucleic acid-binding Zn ribbon protein
MATQPPDPPPEGPSVALRSCPVCGHPVASDAVLCPHCGTALRRRSGPDAAVVAALVLAVAVAVLLAVVIARGGGGDGTPAATATSPPAATAPVAPAPAATTP